MKVILWSQEEDEIIRKYYPLGGSPACLYMIDRTGTAIIKRAAVLGVKFVGKNLGRGAAGIAFEPMVDLKNHYVEEQLDGSRRVYRMDSIRNHEVQKSHPVRKVSHGYSSCHTALEMAA